MSGWDDAAIDRLGLHVIGGAGAKARSAPVPPPGGPVTIVVETTPVPAPRQTRRDVWLNPPRPCVARYRAFCDAVRAAVRAAGVTEVPPRLRLRFEMPIPKSRRTGKDRVEPGQPHQQKPDWDNLAKAVLDAWAKEARVNDDAHVWDVRAEKVWGETGRVVVTALDPTPEDTTTP